MNSEPIFWPGFTIVGWHMRHLEVDFLVGIKGQFLGWSTIVFKREIVSLLCRKSFRRISLHIVIDTRLAYIDYKYQSPDPV